MMDFFKPYFWRIIFFLLGLAVAVSFLTIGFWKTCLILLLCGIGYVVGINMDLNLNLLKQINKVISRRR